MNKLSLFSGIGGDDLASEWAGIDTICFVEIDKYCQKVLHKHWPDIPIIERVQDVTREKVMADTTRIGRRGRGYGNERGNCRTLQIERPCSTHKSGISTIDIISGGFPCQPHSVAGKRKGSTDERNLWPEFRRIIGEIRPRWVVAENVPGIFSSDAGWFFGEILNDLAKMGYSTGWCTFGAVDVGALHRRNRVFIVGWNTNGRDRNKGQVGKMERGEDSKPAGICGTMADSDRERQLQPQGIIREFRRRLGNGSQDVPDSTTRLGQSRSSQCDVRGLQDKAMRVIWNPDYWAVEPNVGRVAHGIPSRVDRLKGLGNAVVPQQIYPIYKAIVDIERLLA